MASADKRPTCPHRQHANTRQQSNDVNSRSVRSTKAHANVQRQEVRTTAPNKHHHHTTDAPMGAGQRHRVPARREHTNTRPHASRRSPPPTGTRVLLRIAASLPIELTIKCSKTCGCQCQRNPMLKTSYQEYRGNRGTTMLFAGTLSVSVFILDQNTDGSEEKGLFHTRFRFMRRTRTQ